MTSILHGDWAKAIERQQVISKTLWLMRAVGQHELLPRWQSNGNNPSFVKRDGSVASEADLAAEAAYKLMLPDIIPGSIVLGEEGVDADPEILSRAREHEWVWIVDPLDGTSQFLQGTPVFATVVALLHHGQTVLGAIHQPASGHMALAIKGHGVQYNNGESEFPVKRFVPPQHGGEFANLTAIFAYHGTEKPLLEPVMAGHPNHLVHKHAHADYLAMLGGGAQFIRFSEGKGKCPPWDHAAGVLMVEEMGGIVRVDDGVLLKPYDPTIRHDRLVVAVNPEVLQLGLEYTSGIEQMFTASRRATLDAAPNSGGTGPGPRV